MSNTIIQIKRSTTTATPTSLSIGELAYSYQSNKLFIGNSTGTGVIDIVGSTANDILSLGVAVAGINVALNGVNTAISGVNGAITTANTRIDGVGIALNGVNTSILQANVVRNQVNTAIAQANVALNGVNGAITTANTNITNLGGAVASINGAFNTANTTINNAFLKTGGTITGPVTISSELTVTGNLVVGGNTTYVSTENLRVSDPLIYLANNNYSSDIVDIGFVANYVNATGSNVHTGFFRDATIKEYFVFEGYDQEPSPNHIDTAGNNFTISMLNANLRTSNIILAGQNTIAWITNAFTKANTVGVALDGVNGAITTANSNITAAFNKANGAVQLGFVTFTVGGTGIVADSNNDTMTITSGNGVGLIVDSGTDSFNIALTKTGVTSAIYGGPSTIPTFNVDEWGRLTAATNVSISIDTSAIASGTLSVARGGTGVGTHTNNYVLLGNTTGSIKSVGSTTAGHVLQINDSNLPEFAMLDGGTF